VTDRALALKFVWYLGLNGSARYESFEDGLLIHARRNDAVAWYHVNDDGSLVHLFDDLLPSRVNSFP
jgi:hypothetical protein